MFSGYCMQIFEAVISAALTLTLTFIKLLRRVTHYYVVEENIILQFQNY